MTKREFVEQAAPMLINGLMSSSAGWRGAELPEWGVDKALALWDEIEKRVPRDPQRSEFIEKMFDR